MRETGQERVLSEHPHRERTGGGIPLRLSNYIFLLVTILMSAALLLSDMMINRGYKRMEQASERYISAELAAMDLEAGSDYLTENVRSFVVTGEVQYLRNFFEEVKVTRRRDRAVESLERLLTENSDAYASLVKALDYSNELLIREYTAMRLMLEVQSYDPEDIPDEISSLVPSGEDLSLDAEALQDRAGSLVFDDEYTAYKEKIRDHVSQCTEQLIASSGETLDRASSRMEHLLRIQTLLTVLMLMTVLFWVIFIRTQVRKPLTRMVDRMKEQQPVPPVGAAELRFVTQTYNGILEENRKTHQQLSYEASHDALTGLFNRSAYEMFMTDIDRDHIALLLIDVDRFKSVNDTYGHDVGDRVLKRVAEILKQSFRSVDIICRIGGDEFVVIMTRANSSMSRMVKEKIARANDLLQHPQEGLPKVSLSVGVAFSDRKNPEGDIFRDADTALYRVKEAGRCGCEVYGTDGDISGVQI